MDYSGNVDYDVNTPFKYEGDDQDHPPSSGGVGGAADDPNKHMPVHHNQDDLIYPPLDFATPTPNAVDTPHSAPSIRHHMNNQSAHGLDLNPNSNAASSILSGTTSSVAMETNSSDAPVAMETNSDAAVTMETSDVRPPSSPESDEIPLAARRTRPSRSTRSKKSLVEVNDEEEDEFEVKPPKGIKLYEDISPALIGFQSIFCSAIQKERRARLTKGSKRKKKKEPEFCRFCFTNELSLHKIRSAKLPPTSSHPNTKLTSLVPTLTEIDLCLTEKWTNPSFQLVCDDCVTVFSQFHEFRTAVQTNDTLLRRLYCSSKAKSKKPPTPAVPPRAQSPAPIPSTGKGRRRALNYKDPTSEEDSDARSIVSKKKSTRGRRKGVTDDEETDGYLSSVSKASRKSTTSRRGANKKKRGGVTSDEETDGYVSSVSRKSTNTTPAAKSNSKKKKRYNSDSDNEDVKSDVSDGMDFGPTAYESSDDISRESSPSRSRGRQSSAVKTQGQQNHRPSPSENSLPNHDDEDDNSDVDLYARVVVKKEVTIDEIEVKTEPLVNEITDGDVSRRYGGSDSDRESDSYPSQGTHFLSKAATSTRTANLKTVLESNLGTLVNKSSSKSQNYLAVIMKNYENRAVESVQSEAGDPASDLEDKPLAKRKTKSRRNRERSLLHAGITVKKESRDKSVERKPRRKSLAEDSDTDYQPDVEAEPPPVERVKKKKEKRERRKKKKEKIKREKTTTGDEMSDFAFSSYESESSDSSLSERELFGPIVYKCRHCEVTFRTYELLLRHLTSKHGGFESAALCFICGFYHKHKKMIYRHIKEHIEPKKMEKKVCDICSAEVIHLGTHQKVAHSGVTYNCKFCSMKFTRVGQMNIHIKTVHLKHMLEKKFVCQYCNKEFPFQGYLNKHMKTHNHHGNGPGPGGGHVTYTCKHCQLTFNNKHAFRNHKLMCGAQAQQQQQQNTSAPNALAVHPSTSSMSEQDVLQQQQQQLLQHSAAELSSIHQIQTSFPLKLERASMYYF